MQLRSSMPNEIAGVMWVAMDTPATSVYTPWYLGIKEVPKSYSIGEPGNYDPESAWWNFQEVGNLCYRRFNEAAPLDVIPVWKEFETKQFISMKETEQKAMQLYNKKFQGCCNFTSKPIFEQARNSGSKNSKKT